MNITKYMHACLVLEKDSQRIVVDPGAYSEDFAVPENVVAIVVTHEHPDHLDIEKLKAITATSPGVMIYAHADVLAKVEGLKTQAVTADETVTAGAFKLSFTGGEHALIHSIVPKVANLGVLVDDDFYYPGDSYALPGANVRVVAVPASGPWMKASEAMDFIKAVKATKAFPTHDAHLSSIGQAGIDNWLRQISSTVDTNYERLPLGEAVEL